MVGEDETTVERAAAARASNAHPAGGECGGGRAETTSPGRASGRRRRKDQGAAPVGGFCRGGQRDSARPIHFVEALDGFVRVDGADRGIDAGEQTLRLAERVDEQEARLAGFLI